MIVSSQTLNFEMHYFITWWIFLTECWCNGLLNCVPFTYQTIFFLVQVHFKYQTKAVVYLLTGKNCIILRIVAKVIPQNSQLFAICWWLAIIHKSKFIIRITLNDILSTSHTFYSILNFNQNLNVNWSYFRHQNSSYTSTSKNIFYFVTVCTCLYHLYADALKLKI